MHLSKVACSPLDLKMIPNAIINTVNQIIDNTHPDVYLINV